MCQVSEERVGDIAIVVISVYVSQGQNLLFLLKKKSQVAPNLISKNAKLDRSTSRVVLFIGILTAVAGGFVRQSTGRGHKMFVLANSSFIQQTHVSKTQHMYGPDS
jgi:hypothetical protein